MTSSIEQQIKDIEDEIFNTQKNKATEHHIGKLKAKIARLKGELEKRKSAGAKGKGFSLKKSGDATVGIIGFPSVGKSTLLNALTDASSKIGDYDFTTLDVIPGVLKYKGANILLYDLPGLITGASKGKGRGREILSAVRTVDMLILMIDTQHLDHLDVIEKELYNAGLRLNQTKPDVVITKTGHGGIFVNTTIKLTHLDESLVKAITSEFLINAHILIRDDITEDQLIDVLSQNRVYVPAIVVINKIDLADEKQVKEIENNMRQRGLQVVSISAKSNVRLDKLREEVFSRLRLIRIYMKPVGKPVDYDEPMILRKGDTIGTVCKRLHRDFEEKFRYAVVSGSSAKHESQHVGLDHILHDKDILTVVIKN